MPTISFELVVIHASGTEGDVNIDPNLKNLKEVLVATGYKKFKRLKLRPYTCPEWRQLGEPLPEGYQLTMVTKFLKDGSPAVKVSVTHKSNKRKPLIQATIPLKKGKPILIDGPRLKDGVLLLCFIGK